MKDQLSLPLSVRLLGVATLVIVGAALAFAAPPKKILVAQSQTSIQTEQTKTWRNAMVALPLGKGGGCFQAEFPKTEWVEVTCAPDPKIPVIPRPPSPTPSIIGGSSDYSAQVPELINGIEGSFDTVSGVTSVTSDPTSISGSGTTSLSDAYTLQINSDNFNSPMCGGSPNPNCRGWQQFVYASKTYQAIFMQYWLIQYNTSCPVAWNTFSFPGGTDIYCYKNSSITNVPNQSVINLGNLTLYGNANISGNDEVKMKVGPSTMYAASGLSSELGLSTAWHTAEFIVAGDAEGRRANFNAGATIVVRTTVHHGNTNAPNCIIAGFTGETNNLNLTATPGLGTGPSPAITSQQSNAGSSIASCSNANGIGDPHLTTFGGLLYDFQASGDFLLAQTGSDFAVQGRQVSGAPQWPDAAVYQGVGALLGKTRVAICAPDGLVIDGKPMQLDANKPLSLKDGAAIVRRGNVYLMADQSGNSVQATVNGNYIDVSVGLGRWPAGVVGLLADASDGKVAALRTREGAILKAPFSLEQLYKKYGDGWRVSSKNSLLADCGKGTSSSNPKRFFFAKDLKGEVLRKALATCKATGVKEGALLEACALDVAVIGRKTAANTFVRKPAPKLTATYK